MFILYQVLSAAQQVKGQGCQASIPNRLPTAARSHAVQAERGVAEGFLGVSPPFFVLRQQMDYIPSWICQIHV